MFHTCSTRLPSCFCDERTHTRLPREVCKQMWLQWFQDNVQSSKSQNGPSNGAPKEEHMCSDTRGGCINAWNILEIYKWKSKIHILDTIVAGLRPASRSEHVLHFSSLFLIDFLLGTSRGASLFTVASPQQNRAANWKLISWSAGQTHQNMFDQPRFDYVPPFNFNWLNTQSTRKREGMDSMTQWVSKWFDDKNGHLRHLSETGQLQNLKLSTHMQWGAGKKINVYKNYTHYWYIIQIWWIFDGVFCDRHAVSQLALRALLTGLALADWPVRDGRRREGLGSCIPSDIRDVNRHTKKNGLFTKLNWC